MSLHRMIARAIGGGRGEATVPTVHARAVVRAIEICGDEQLLAVRLGVSETLVRLWAQGSLLPPEHVFLRVVDLLSEHAIQQMVPGQRRDTPD